MDCSTCEYETYTPDDVDPCHSCTDFNPNYTPIRAQHKQVADLQAKVQELEDDITLLLKQKEILRDHGYTRAIYEAEAKAKEATT